MGGGQILRGIRFLCPVYLNHRKPIYSQWKTSQFDYSNAETGFHDGKTNFLLKHLIKTPQNACIK